jgi:dCMP deaminase
MRRTTKTDYYLDIAEVVAKRGTCIRRNYGAVIVNNDEVISTGYSGSPRNTRNCCDLKICLREEKNIPSGQRYELCRSVHAEMNACISANRKDMFGGSIYICGIIAETGDIFPKTMPCKLCLRTIINSSIKKFYVRTNKEDYSCFLTRDFLNEI